MTEYIDRAFIIITGISTILLLIIMFFMVYSLIKFNKKRNPVAASTRENKLLEITWIVVPFILVMIMFYYGWTGFKPFRKIPPDAIGVKVYAQMWMWTYEYENGKTSTELYVPAGRPVKLELISRDVVHSFYIPELKIKEDAVPNLKNRLWFKIDRPAEYKVFCAEYCGTLHYNMRSKIVAVEEEKFKEFLKN